MRSTSRSRLPWRRVAVRPRRRAHGRCGGGSRRTRGGGGRAPDRSGRRRRARAQGTEGGAALDARAGRALRSRGGRPPSRRAALRGRQAAARRAVLRAARLGRGARRTGVRRLARRDGRPHEPPRRAASAGRGRPAQPRRGPLLGRPAGSGGRLARRRGLRAGHGVRGGRRQPPPSRLREGPSDLRHDDPAAERAGGPDPAATARPPSPRLRAERRGEAAVRRRPAAARHAALGGAGLRPGGA